MALRTWAERVAGGIHDPVKRLRFLRAVAPLANLGMDRRPRWSRPLAAAAIVIASAAAFLALVHPGAGAQQPPAGAPQPVASTPAEPAHERLDVWLVEHTASSDVYSNGLRIDNTFAVSNVRRSYIALPIDGSDTQTTRTDPAGIVFHGTESQQIPFEAGHNEMLKRIGESLLEYVQRRRSYHFVIDRFGRVHRVVAESDSADHAGYSVWSDSRWLYINLNQSFFGVAFEARTAPSDAEALMTTAQSRSAAMLVEMLRARYAIPGGNCVTHAQVSVNPSNMRIGYHVDWASDFPFRDVGLPDNYAIPLPSIARWGFDYPPALRATRGLGAGIASAEGVLTRDASAGGERPAKWRMHLRQQYRRGLAAVRHGRM